MRTETPSSGRAGLLTTLAVIAVLFVGGAAVYELRKASQENASVEAAKQQLKADQDRLRTLARKEQAAADKLSALQKSSRTALTTASETTRPVPAPDNARSRLDEQKINGQKFLQRYPQVRSMLLSVGKYQYESAFAPFYKQAALTTDQISRLESATMDLWAQSLAISPQGGIFPTQIQLPADQLTAIIGPQAYQQFQDYNRQLPAQNFSLQVAAEAGLASVPISPDQANQLAQIVSNNSAPYHDGKNVDLSNVDWNAVMTQASAANLTPAQTEAMQNVAQKLQYQMALRQARQAATSGNQ
jgi:hypothetical protein